MSVTEGGGARGGERGPLTTLTAVRVAVRVRQYEVEPCNWAARVADPDPGPLVGMSGTLGDFDSDPEIGRGKAISALRVRDPDPVLEDSIRARVEDALRGNYLHVKPSAPVTFRVTTQTFHEADRSHQITVIRTECLQGVRLPEAPSAEVPAVIWAREQVSWDDVAQRCWPMLYVVSALSGFLRDLHGQKPTGWYADLAMAHPGGLPASPEEGTGLEEKGDPR